MIKNDGDIVEAFVRHHAMLFDHLVVLDHSSTDNTPAILRALQHEGLPLTVMRDESLSFQQGLRTTELARAAFARLGADFVFPLDADELLKVASRPALETALAAIPQGQCGRLRWQNYIVTAADDTAQLNPVARIRHRAQTEPKEEHKVVLPRGSLADPSWQIAYGNHFLTRETAAGVETALTHDIDGAVLAHFPVRSQEQLHQKIILGWLSVRLQNPVDFKPVEAAASADTQFWHWRDLFASTLRNPQFSAADLQRFALALYVHKCRIDDPLPPMSLVEDPLPVPYSLRYTAPATDVALTSLARWTDRLLTRVGDML